MAGMQKPRVYVIQNDSPNAFATGRNQKHAAVAATTGIMSILDDKELTAVFGHEIGHIKNRDILVNAIVATVATAIMFLANMAQWALIFGGLGGRDRNGASGIVGIVAMLAMIILAPIAATMIRMAISRQREFGADAGGARISHKPLALAEALNKLHSGVQRYPMNRANPATAHMFIVAPFSGKQVWSLFSTHPPVEERIARLYDLAKHM